jgi:RNA polymerase sigma-70 factor (ECF subfamily)
VAIDERELEDAFLVEAAQQGDADAFTELFRRHYPTVRRVCAGRLGNAVEADEVAQAAFVRAYERIDQCVGERRFGAWVQVIAYRMGADARRSQARSLLTGEPIGGDATLGPNYCEDELLRSEQAAEVREVLASLPARQREVIVARDLEGRRPGEIAASLGLSLSAVDSLLLRARRRMAVAWRAASPEGGLVSPHVASASLAATSAVATVAEPGSLRLLSRFGDAIARASFRLADGLGILPGPSTLVQRAGGLVAAGALAAVPVVAVLPTAPAVSSSVASRPTDRSMVVSRATPLAPIAPAAVGVLATAPATVASLTGRAVPVPAVAIRPVHAPHLALPPPGSLAGPNPAAGAATTTVTGIETTVAGTVATVTSKVTGPSSGLPAAVGGLTAAVGHLGTSVAGVVGSLGPRR